MTNKMNRTDRLLAIVLELQAKKMLRAEDLAAIFEVTKRTIYRDMLALCEAGVPVVSLPRQGYSLVEGYFLPPLSFSTEEAMMLLLGSDFAAQNFDANYREAAESASRKIEAVLPEALRTEIGYLQRSIRFMVCNVSDPLEMLQQLRRAILSHNRVRFCYHARISADEQMDGQLRDVDPYALVHIGGKWQLVGYCHLRHDIRHFRLDRIEGLTLLNSTFARPSSFKFGSPKLEGREITVRVLFDATVARWVHESLPIYKVAEEQNAEGLLVTFKVRHEDELFQWLFSWGAHLRILEPNSLRERLVQEAGQMQRNLAG
ncbi:MAG: helix-turn-helix transcriptional regulator [Aggregatilineales bacterium]